MLSRLWFKLFGERKLLHGLAAAKRHIDAGDFERADRLCVELLGLAPRELAADLHFLRGLIARQQRRLDAAIGHFRGALAHRAANPALLLALADACRELPDVAEAERTYRRLLEIEPGHAGALLQLAVLRESSDPEDARSLMDRRIRVRDGAAARLRRALMLPSIVQSEDEIELVRARLDRDLDEILARRWPAVQRPEHEIGSTAFALAYHGRNDRELMRKLGRACRSVYPARTELPAGRRPPGRRLRVGFVSMYFHFHSIARTHTGFLADLPRGQFDVYVFAIAPRDDDWARAIRTSAEHYVALPLDLERARDAIESAALDVLLYTDLGMDPHTYFLAFWRLAPLQAVSWGHPVTTGIDTIDCFVSAAGLEAPGSDDQYTETLVRLPGYFMPRYRRPRSDAPADVRARLGLPADARVYCCLQTLFKLHPRFDLALRDILDGDARAAIVLLESNPGWMDRLRRRLERSLGAAVSRVCFAPRMAQPDYQRFVAGADVVLDPFHFGGANSSCEALACGIPIVTLPAFQLRGRFTLGLYEELGVRECIATSPEDYVAIALRLGRDPEYRGALSSRIRAGGERLFERADAGRALAQTLPRLAARRP